MNSTQIFESQTRNLIDKNYPQLAGMSEVEFITLIKPLKQIASKLDLPEINSESGFIPFVLVIKHTLIPSQKSMSAVNRQGKSGITKLFPLKPEDFNTVSEETIPPSSAYLLIDIDRGKDTINLPPSEAIKTIRQKSRLTLTIDEGIAIITHYPDFLQKNNCFSLLGSRHTGDQRVPAIWINSAKQPNLGWCWNGNPHTWLGSASAAQRIGY